jgi:hypothetical protein
MNLITENVPAGLRTLIPLAEKWGISDDFDREIALRNASAEELMELVKSLKNIYVAELSDWLSGPEATNEKISDEYVAFTCLTMAIDSAKLKLKKSAYSNGIIE